MADFNLIIRGGTIVDGGGGAPFVGDVAIAGDRIAALGVVCGSGVEEIDASGLLVTPGFVDIHTHFDGQAIWESRLAPTSWHGVTTVVMGNCGVGFAPVRAADRDSLIALMERVEDVPNPCLAEGLDWQWESFADFIDALERRSHDADTCQLLPHAALRLSDASFPSYLLSHWGREAADGFPIAEIVRRLTRVNPEAVGLGDRGLLAVGSKADINLIDLAAIALHRPHLVHDLPAGGTRLMQRADGFVAILLSGAVTYRTGEATDALPGCLVRGPQSDPRLLESQELCSG